jgi:Lrp/AsnC family leucine-responsive transcriptional regulator
MASKPERLLDEIGWNILAALQQNARISFSDLGRHVGLSAPAAAERVRRMEEAGIITGYRVSLAVEKLGYPITALLRISAPEENCVRLGAVTRALPQVVESHRVTGSDRLVLKVSAASVNHLDETIHELSRYGTVTAAIVLSSRTATVARPPAASGTARARHGPRARR